ncbi:hypothetical protein TRFO_09130 [Tritrichomonas foetus]|uniref:Myb-like DNA-binding domain containing protein n=1 Tax=Tritrichomonas foetus TaxID=1144522 RepID=A0A1J4JKB3_9EUKA|nr:hypothetical protein TRFO_09130 [Tritrichomonas foetus]|eukprot:OHS97979.1 hypothetical protein TRFO_09130 [Tritrichomonas foetus]
MICPHPAHPEAIQALIAVGSAYVSDTVGSSLLSQSILTKLESVFHTYLKGEIPYAAAAHFFMVTISTTKPLDKMNAIMNMQDAPLPNISDYPIEAQTFLLRKKSRPWTEYEDMRLLAGISRFGLDGWGSVAQFVGNSRTKAQCCQRWVRGLDPRISKVHWTAEEDNRLLELVAKYGQKSWTKISSEFGNRCDVQCRYRFKQLTAVGPSPEDDQNFPNNCQTAQNQPNGQTTIQNNLNSLNHLNSVNNQGICSSLSYNNNLQNNAQNNISNCISNNISNNISSSISNNVSSCMSSSISSSISISIPNVQNIHVSRIMSPSPQLSRNIQPYAQSIPQPVIQSANPICVRSSDEDNAQTPPIIATTSPGPCSSVGQNMIQNGISGNSSKVVLPSIDSFLPRFQSISVMKSVGPLTSNEETINSPSYSNGNPNNEESQSSQLVLPNLSQKKS